jgi:hypothetical protein
MCFSWKSILGTKRRQSLRLVHANMLPRCSICYIMLARSGTSLTKTENKTKQACWEKISSLSLWCSQCAMLGMFVCEFDLEICAPSVATEARPFHLSAFWSCTASWSVELGQRTVLNSVFVFAPSSVGAIQEKRRVTCFVLKVRGEVPYSCAKF